MVNAITLAVATIALAITSFVVGPSGFGNVLLLLLLFQCGLFTLAVIGWSSESFPVPPRWAKSKRVRFHSYTLFATAFVCAYNSAWLSALLAIYCGCMSAVATEIVKDLVKKAGASS